MNCVVLASRTTGGEVHVFWIYVLFVEECISFVAIFSVLDGLKALVSSLNTFISFISFFILFISDGLHDDEISCLRKWWDRLDGPSLSCTFLLLCLELLFFKLGLFNGAQAVNLTYEGCTEFLLSLGTTAGFWTCLGLCFR